MIRAVLIAGFLGFGIRSLAADLHDHDPGRAVPRDQPEETTLTPWRNGGRERTEFFPESTTATAELCILSGVRVELGRLLGHPPDKLFERHRILRGKEGVGWVLVRRFKGSDGVVELVLALTDTQTVVAARLQRSRESGRVNEALSGFLLGLRGKTVDSVLATPAVEASGPEMKSACLAVHEALVMQKWIAEKGALLPRRAP